MWALINKVLLSDFWYSEIQKKPGQDRSYYDGTLGAGKNRITDHVWSVLWKQLYLKTEFMSLENVLKCLESETDCHGKQFSVAIAT